MSSFPDSNAMARKHVIPDSLHSPIGHRRKPQPDGQPGYVRVDTVHQGDQDGAKGVYHINWTYPDLVDG